MTVYRYVVVSRNGQRKTGTIEAIESTQAKRLLSSNGDRIVDLKEASKRTWLSLERRTSLPPHDIAVFARELSNLLNAGAPLRKALDIQTQSKGASATLASNIGAIIDNGGSLSDGLRNCGAPAQLLAEFVSAGEAGAGISQLLDTGAEFLKTRHEAMKKFRAALAYPLFIILLACLAFGVVTVYVAPALAPSLQATDQNTFLLVLSDIGTWTQSNSSIVLICSALFVTLIFLLLRQHTTKRYLNSVVWSLPVLGTIVKDLDTGQSCNVLSALLESGRPLENSLKFAAAVSGPQLAATYLSIAERLRDGEVASSAFAAEENLPLEVRRLALLGERSSAFAKSISQAGQLCSDRAVRRIDRLAAIAGPALVIGMGSIIAVLMISVLGSLSSIGDIG